MAGQTRGWLKGCAIGCGGFALVALAAIGSVTVRTCAPVGNANQALESLDARFGTQDSFVPAPDGAVPADRLQRFIEVRGALMEPCERFAPLREKMDRVETLDERVDDASGREVADTTGGLVKVAIDLTPLIGEFFERRNESLLAAEMGLGEYTYIYALAYRKHLLEKTPGELFMEEGPVPAEALAALRVMLGRQLEAATPKGRERLEAEFAALQQDPVRLPWRDGLPPAVEASLAPLRDRLDQLHCPATTGIEMDVTARRAILLALY